MADPIPVDIEVKTWDYAHDDTSMLQVVLSYPASTDGRRFSLVTSGQFALKPDANPNFFCDSGNQSVRAGAARKCDSKYAISSVSDLEYRLDDQLGRYSIDGVHSVIDRHGYDKRTADVVTGIFSPRQFRTGRSTCSCRSTAWSDTNSARSISGARHPSSRVTLSHG